MTRRFRFKILAVSRKQQAASSTGKHNSAKHIFFYAYDSGFVDPRLLDVATGGVWDSFVLLPRILGCWGSFARAFLPGRLVFLFIALSSVFGVLRDEWKRERSY